jgi:anti-sigma factor RsiW
MCPDRQILSVYFDGELPSPWKAKMESHLEQCSECRRRLEAYRRMSPDRAAPETAARIAAVQGRVWQKLESAVGVAANAAPAGKRVLGHRYGGIWTRRVSVPLPAAAAAAVMALALAVLLIRKPAAAPAVTPDMTLASEADLTAPGIIPVSDMDSVLQYLGSRDSSDFLILRLPESRNFTSSGEPAIIKAADYSRNVPGRRYP